MGDVGGSGGITAILASCVATDKFADESLLWLALRVKKLVPPFGLDCPALLDDDDDGADFSLFGLPLP